MLSFAKKVLAATTLVAVPVIVGGCADKTTTVRKDVTTTDHDRDGVTVKTESKTTTKDN